MGLTKAALEAVRTPDYGDLIRLGDHIEGLIEAWTLATNEERHKLLTMMLDAVYVDMQSGTIEGVKPKPEFLPLFNLAEPVRAGETVLVTALLDSPPSPPRTRFRTTPVSSPWTPYTVDSCAYAVPVRFTDRRSVATP